MLQVTIDDRALRRFLRGAPKKFRFAMKNALNETAKQVVKEERRVMKRVFDRPTRWILRGMWIRFAHTARLQAEVKFKDQFSTSKEGATAEEIMLPHIRGGPRRQKRGERALASRGRMGGKRYYVPGQGARLNRYGNITPAQINKILSGVQGQRDSFQDTTRRSKYFILNRNGQPHGVYQRLKTKVKPMLIFVGPPHYRRRLDFFGIAERTIKRWWPVKMNRALRNEIRRVGR